jgi:hypothetical protein
MRGSVIRISELWCSALHAYHNFLGLGSKSRLPPSAYCRVSGTGGPRGSSPACN